jgi:hypothetical protein
MNRVYSAFFKEFCMSGYVRRHLGVCVRSIAGVAAVLAMTVPSLSAQREKIDKDLEAAISARQRAVDTGDAAAWSKLTADNFVSVIENGRIRNKAERLSDITKRNTPAPGTVVDSLTVTSPDSAVLVQHDGKDEQRVLMLWMRQGGSWKCVSSVNVSMKR